MDANRNKESEENQINERLKKRFKQTDLSRIEAAAKIMTVELASPEGKRLFLRYFDSLQLALNYVQVTARRAMEEADVAKGEKLLLDLLTQMQSTVQEEIADAAKRLDKAGVTKLACYTTPPLTGDVAVYSLFGRRYLELLTSIDHQMLLLETLAFDELISIETLQRSKANLKKIARHVNSAATGLSRQFRKLINPTKPLAEDEGGEAGGQAPAVGEQDGVDDEIETAEDAVATEATTAAAEQ